MNKEFNENNYPSHSHQEGQQHNIAEDRQNGGINQPPIMDDAGVQTQTRKGQTRQEGEEGRNENQRNNAGRPNETESDRANNNEDEGQRGGNSSI